MANGHLLGGALSYYSMRTCPYFYETLEGEEFNRALNGKHFKKYYPSIWVDA